jgi:hypothetical protein
MANFSGWKQFVGTSGLKLLRLEIHCGTRPNGFPCAFVRVRISAAELSRWPSLSNRCETNDCSAIYRSGCDTSLASL